MVAATSLQRRGGRDLAFCSPF